MALRMNRLGPLFCNSIVAAVVMPDGRYKRLVELELGDNPIGDDGVTILAPLLLQVETVGLRRVGFTDTGCLALASNLRVVPGDNDVYVTLHLDIGYNGIQTVNAIKMVLDRIGPALKTLFIEGNPVCKKKSSIDELEKNALFLKWICGYRTFADMIRKQTKLGSTPRSRSSCVHRSSQNIETLPSAMNYSIVVCSIQNKKSR